MRLKNFSSDPGDAVVVPIGPNNPREYGDPGSWIPGPADARKRAQDDLRLAATGTPLAEADAIARARMGGTAGDRDDLRVEVPSVEQTMFVMAQAIKAIAGGGKRKFFTVHFVGGGQIGNGQPVVNAEDVLLKAIINNTNVPVTVTLVNGIGGANVLDPVAVLNIPANAAVSTGEIFFAGRIVVAAISVANVNLTFSGEYV